MHSELSQRELEPSCNHSIGFLSCMTLTVGQRILPASRERLCRTINKLVLDKAPGSRKTRQTVADSLLPGIAVSRSLVDPFKVPETMYDIGRSV